MNKSLSLAATEKEYTELANAIIVRAAKDYEEALKRLAKHPNSSTALFTKAEVERFLRSGWFAALTDLDPEMLIQKLNREVAR